MKLASIVLCALASLACLFFFLYLTGQEIKLKNKVIKGEYDSWQQIGQVNTKVS
jgi:hypothetical protein